MCAPPHSSVLSPPPRSRLRARLSVEGPQRPNLKSEDSGLRHRFSEAKVSLWMCENGTGHEESRGPTRRRLCCTPFQNFSQRERDVEECHRRVGRVGPEHQSSRRGRGEQRRPLRRRVGNMGACPPPLRGRSAVCRPKRRISLWRAKDRLACRFRLDGGMEASRLHAAVKSEPVCGDHSARRRYMRAFPSKFGAKSHCWILGRCGPHTTSV